jgi:hypothetical protein
VKLVNEHIDPNSSCAEDKQWRVRSSVNLITAFQHLRQVLYNHIVAILPTLFDTAQPQRDFTVVFVIFFSSHRILFTFYIKICDCDFVTFYCSRKVRV